MARASDAVETKKSLRKALGSAQILILLAVHQLIVSPGPSVTIRTLSIFCRAERQFSLRYARINAKVSRAAQFITLSAFSRIGMAESPIAAWDCPANPCEL